LSRLILQVLEFRDLVLQHPHLTAEAIDSLSKLSRVPGEIGAMTADCSSWRSLPSAADQAKASTPIMP
jgi:hypothetical protein